MRLGKRWWVALGVVACGCGRKPAPVDAAAPTQACLHARELRTAAATLDRDGHEMLAKAKLDEANAACATERARSGDLEARVLAALEGPTAPSKGTDATMRAKMREAFAAEHVKDYARAEALYLDAWAEHHPNPVAIESAARMAARAGAAARARRLRDRALFEAEASERTTAVVSNRVRASAGAGTLVGGTLTIADHGKVVARDVATGELRVLLDAPEPWWELSPLGTLGIASDGGETYHVYDLLTGTQLLAKERLSRIVASPNDELLAVHVVGAGNRIVDVATGAIRATLPPVTEKLDALGFASNGDVVFFDGSTDPFSLREWDAKKSALRGWSMPTSRMTAKVSANGKYLVTVGVGDYEQTPLLVRDVDAGKTVAQWSGRFGTLEALDVTGDAAVVATGSHNSVRLWTVADKKQRFVANRTRRGDNFDDDLGVFALSDDGKSVVLGRDRRTMLWDVATGTETEAVTNQREKNVLRARPLGRGGVVFVLDDSVRVVPEAGDAHALCRGFHQHFYPDVGPTDAVVSPSGKLLVCSMTTGTIHVFDASTYKELSSFRGPDAGRTRNNGMVDSWEGVPPATRPVDLAVSADDATLTVVADSGLFTYDTHTGKETSHVALRDPKLPMARRHARFADGRMLVKTSHGSGALFDAHGVYQRTVDLVPGARLDAPDAFSADGRAYAVALGDELHRADLDGGGDRTTKLPVVGTAIALSPNGKVCVVIGKDGTAYRVDAAPKKIESAGATRAFFLGEAIVVVTGRGDTLDLFAGDEPEKTLEIDPNGLVARGAAGAFEVRGRAEAECVVGHLFLSQETCADRTAPGLVAAWLRAASK